MPRETIEVNDLAKVGSVADVPSYMLPPEVWSFAQNVRAKDLGMEKLFGWEGVFVAADADAGNDEFTKVLLHFDGSDGSTTITDSNAGGSSHTWTATTSLPNGAVDTAQSKFGGASLACGGGSNVGHVSTPDHADFVLGSGDFTIDCWFYNTAGAGSLNNFLVSHQPASGSASGWYILHRGATGSGRILATFAISAFASLTVQSTTQFTSALNLGWHHLAVVKDETRLSLYIDGVMEGTTDPGASWGVMSSGASLLIGYSVQVPVFHWGGWIDEFRVSVGVARWTATFSPPGVPYAVPPPGPAAEFLMPISTSAQNYWLYASLVGIYAYDGSAHHDVTRTSGAYTVTNGSDWNGTVLGGVPILNNGSDVPQYWPMIDTSTKFANLLNWPSTLRADIVRAHGPFLIAAGLRDSGVSYPHRIRWSHPADPGTVPVSWDITDATKDTGEIDLPDVNSGTIEEMLPLSNYMYVFKETSTWRGRYVGGRSVFDFGENPWLPTVGALAHRCVALTGDGLRQCVATQDDIIWHNGNTVRSILTSRQRRRLANQIDSVNYQNSFMFCNPLFNEMWFCFPSAGNEWPDLALIMNYSDPEAWVVTEADGITFRHAAVGGVEVSTEERWEDNPGETWSDASGPWSEFQRRRVVLADPTRGKFYNLDSGSTRDGTPFVGTLRREGLAIEGRKRNGEWIVDHQSRKLSQRVWPKVQGGPISLKLGAAEVVNGAVLWGAVEEFNPLLMVYCDPAPASGRAMAIEFSATNGFRLDGYKYDVTRLGEF